MQITQQRFVGIALLASLGLLLFPSVITLGAIGVWVFGVWHAVLLFKYAHQSDDMWAIVRNIALGFTFLLGMGLSVFGALTEELVPDFAELIYILSGFIVYITGIWGAVVLIKK